MCLWQDRLEQLSFFFVFCHRPLLKGTPVLKWAYRHSYPIYALVVTDRVLFPFICSSTTLLGRDLRAGQAAATTCAAAYKSHTKSVRFYVLNTIQVLQPCSYALVLCLWVVELGRERERETESKWCRWCFGWWLEEAVVIRVGDDSSEGIELSACTLSPWKMRMKHTERLKIEGELQKRSQRECRRERERHSELESMKKAKWMRSVWSTGIRPRSPWDKEREKERAS